MRGTTLVCVVAFVIGVVAGAEDRATVFLVPHTHCDPGWLDTYQGYYDTEVKFILDTVVEQLAANPSYKFTWAETSFFRLWWETQSDSKKNQFRSLLENGQIEFVMGGWSMADEGIVTHEAVVNDMTEGHLYLFDELGVVPKVAWQIDPFGASDTIAALFKMMGLENEVHMRIDWRLRDEMKIQRTLEFIWNTMGTILLPEQNMFTHILEDQYSGPPGMNWEDDTKPVTLLNVEAFALDFITIARERLAMYRTNNLLMLFGHDFAFQNAAVEFGNMTMIVDWINKHESDYNLTVVYSTPSDYFNTIHSTQVEFPTYEGPDFFPYSQSTNCPDFFPYSQSTNCFHSGYYSSHSCLKIRSRQADRAIRWGDQLLSWVVTDSVAPTNEELSMIQEARRNEALIQHHDSVTGTSREIPTDDDMARLEGAIENCTEFATTFMPQLLLRTISSPTPVLSASPDTLKQIDSTHSGVIILENSLGWDRTTPVSVLVYRSDVTVLDNAGSAVPAQVIPNTDGSYTLWFTASVPALGWSTYFISVGQSGYTEITVPGAAGSSVTLDNGVASFVFSNGFLSSITNYERSLKMIVDQKFLQYTSHKDGAYLFRSFRPAHEIANIAAVQVNFTDGQLVQQIEVSILDDTDTQIIKQTTRLFTGLPYAEAFIEINGNQQIDEELITRFSAVIDEDIGHWFFADSVAYNMHKREWRELYGFEGNYFPSSTTVYVADYTSQLTILTDSSHGSSNVAHGEVELIPHIRRSRLLPIFPVDKLYYSSHSCLKIRSRQADRAIRWGDQLLSWVVTDSVAPTNEELSMIQEARRNEALIQHHDSVTGTSREIPTDDDMARLEGAIENCTEFATTFMPKLLLRTISSPTPVLSASPDTLKQIDSTHSGVIILENSLGWDRATPVSVLVYRSDVTVMDNAGSAVPAQVIPNTDGSYTLWFTASVPALGWSTYFISVGQSGYTEITVPGAAGSSVTLDNGVASFVFSNGFLSSITNYERSLKMIVDQKFLQYTSHKDGAYLFRSFRPAHEIANIAAVQVNFTDGQLVQQIEVSILDDTDTQIIKQTTRLFTGLPYAEAFIEINGNQQIDEELITRFSSVIDEDIGHWFFADSVAYNMHKREWRELYGFEGNYFPSSTTVYVADYTSQLTILTDSSHGSSNVAHGEVELMLHRRLSHDDDPAQGVVEPLNDTCSHNDTFWILMDDPSNTTDAVHQYARQLNNPINFLYGTTTDWKQWTSNYQTSYSPIQALPPNIHLFTLAPRLPAIPPPGFQANTLMLRLEHLYGVGESPQYSKPVEIDLSQLLSGDSHQISIDKLQECSLSMNACTTLSSTIITIDPKQIRSFLVTFA
ncbi:lysosomal alpha-mannosidase [Pelomyxa schiedti]|nr:lysosomal alpha-mannosidase [Pelomyxa schiedti]